VQKEYWSKYCKTFSRTTDISMVWKKVKGMRNDQSRNIPAIIPENSELPIVNAIDKANIFLEIFSNMDARLQGDDFNRRNEFEQEVIDKLDLNRESDNALNENFTLIELEKSISEMKDSAPGQDGILPILIRELPDTAFHYLNDLFNEIWDSSILPVQWSHAILIPVLKAGRESSNPSSYRPISLTAIFCKIMERMVKNRMTWFIEKYDVITPLQSGFRKERSTMDQIIRLETDIHKAMLNKEYTIVVFLDLEKAYDLLWRKGIIYKMYEAGLRGKILKWVEAFFSRRTVQVRVDGILSNSKEVLQGIPQGSVISPLLFTFMLNDLEFLNNKVNISFYADDICIWFSSRNLKFAINKIQLALEEIEQWCKRWGMYISSSKSTTVLFGRREKKEVKLRINNGIISQNNSHKFLGIWFDSRLTWSTHIDSIVEKCKKRLNLLRCIAGTQWGGNSHVLMMVYKGLIRPVIDYGCEAYGSASNTLLKKIDSIQYQALRIVTGGLHMTSLAALQIECGEPPLEFRRQMFVDKYKFYLQTRKDNHPTKNILLNCWQYESNSWKQNEGPLMNRACTLEILNFETQEDGIPSTPPWHFVKPNVSFSIHNQVNKKESLPNEQLNCALENIAIKWHTHLHIYTDGSKLDNGLTGAAFYIPKYKISKCYRTSPVNIMTAELTAINLALDWIEDFSPVSVVIFSDSMSALQAIKNMNKDGITLAILDKLTYLSINGINICFEWIPAHCELQGNECADRLAKQATQKEGVDVSIPRNRFHLMNYMKMFYKQLWQNQWETIDKGRFLFGIQPLVTQCINVFGFSRKEERILHQLRLGKCKLNFYKFEINKHETGLCDFCMVFETIEHYLIDCKRYTKERKKLFSRLNVKQMCLQSLLGKEDHLQPVMAFIKATDKYYIL